GAVQRQHDPDWLPNGEIGILNNRMSRDFSEIVSIDPDSFERTTILDGREIDFYTRVRGKHQPLGNGGLVVTSPQQGRAFELSREGDIVFEIANQKPESDTTNYIISEMRWLPPSMFDLGEWECR
ncbi:MAG: arylsulfotransferase family protein, partial [Pseudomonadota bacterium]